MRESERVNSRGEARQLARHRILVEHALGNRAMQFRLGQQKRRSGRLLVAGRNRRLDSLDEGAHPARSGAIGCRALSGLPDPLFG